jgi:hypothetical protein
MRPITVLRLVLTVFIATASAGKYKLSPCDECNMRVDDCVSVSIYHLSCTS